MQYIKQLSYKLAASKVVTYQKYIFLVEILSENEIIIIKNDFWHFFHIDKESIPHIQIHFQHNLFANLYTDRRRVEILYKYI